MILNLYFHHTKQDFIFFFKERKGKCSQNGSQHKSRYDKEKKENVENSRLADQIFKVMRNKQAGTRISKKKEKEEEKKKREQS